MPLLLIISAITIGFLGNKVNFLTDYSFEVQNPKIEFELKSNNENTESIYFIPNMSSFSKLGFGNKFLDFSITVPNEDREEADVDATQLVDIQLQGTRNKIQWEIYYQNYHDLYINNEKKIENGLTTAHIHNYGLGLRYFINDDFSAIHSFGNIAFKKKTNWSWLTGIHYSRSRLHSSLGLIPETYVSQYNDLSGITALDISSTQIELGLASMLASNSIFLSSLVSLGLNLQEQNYEGIDVKNSQTTNSSLQIKLNLGTALGKRHTAGIDVQVNTENIAVKNSSFIKYRSLISLYYKHYF